MDRQNVVCLYYGLMFRNNKEQTDTWMNLKNILGARYRWLSPIILATQEAEIRRIAIRSQPEQIVRKTLS
jgi:hypothetical protein